MRQLGEPGAKQATLHLCKDMCRAIVSTEDGLLMLYATLTTVRALRRRDARRDGGATSACCHQSTHAAVPPQDRAFASFQVESKFRNIIGLEVGLANLTQALRAGQNALHVQLKLIKKGNLPYLSVEAQTVDGGLSVVQDVPVRVLSAVELGRHSEPYIPVPQVGCARFRRASGGPRKTRRGVSLRAHTHALRAHMHARRLLALTTAPPPRSQWRRRA